MHSDSLDDRFTATRLIQPRQKARLRSKVDHLNGALQAANREATFDNWRKRARAKGILMPDTDAGPEGWNARG